MDGTTINSDILHLKTYLGLMAGTYGVYIYIYIYICVYEICFAMIIVHFNTVVTQILLF